MALSLILSVISWLFSSELSQTLALPNRPFFRVLSHMFLLITVINSTTWSCSGGIIAGWLSQYMGRRLTMVCVQFSLTIFLILRLTFNIIHSAHSFPSSVVCKFVYVNYSHIFKFIIFKSFYPPMDLTFLPVLSASSSVCEEHGVSCVNFLAIVTLLHTTLTAVNEYRFLSIYRRCWCRLSARERTSYHYFFASVFSLI